MNETRLARAGGILAIAAGMLGAAIGCFLLLATPAVPADQFNYPLTTGAFVVLQAVQCAQHLLMAGALWLYHAAGLAGRGRLASTALWTSVGALGLLAAWELVAIAGAGRLYLSTETAWIDAGYTVASLGTGIGLVLLGVSSVRVRVITGPTRWWMLATGVYMFVPMIPALFLGYVAGRIALIGWLLLFAGVGAVMMLWAGQREVRTPPLTAVAPRTT